MPFAENEGVRIHYEVEGSGPPLVFLHAFGMQIEDWHDYGYTQEFITHHQVILIDARGFGRSDKPHDPDAYTVSQRVGDVIAVLDQLGIGATGVFGYSMGGLTGYALAGIAPERLSSLAVGGMHPYRRKENHAGREQVKLLERGMDAAVAHWERGGERMAEPRRLRFLKYEPRALIAATKSIWKMPDLSPQLREFQRPTLVFAGTDDGIHDLAQRAAEELPSARFVSFPDIDHADLITRSDLIVPALLEFFDASRE